MFRTRFDTARPVLDTISDAIAAQLADRPGKAVPYSLAAHLAAERGIALPGPRRLQTPGRTNRGTPPSKENHA